MGAAGSICSAPPKVYASPFNASDYEIGDYVAEGGIGKVFSGHEKSTGAKVALKFFGYITGVRINADEIEHEMDALREVLGVNGLVQFKG